ncbi:hypothetical protein Sango_1257200 [Sesamum angolense]|uniref:Reverse transcriptase domain-containing protein n=1 Tax=Sesamum angolense TaxID=2727404 RepID=A0AAE2BU27_9LAMI|nr:hypothetical protein Sango_1257200 [Sesamum angolense]
MEVPVWIKLRHLPIEYWTDEGLSIVASGIGKPLYPNAITKLCTRLDFARVCVMLHIDSKLPKHIVIMVPMDDVTTCPAKRVTPKAPVEVYVKRAVPNSEPLTSSIVPMKESSTVGAVATIPEPRLEKVVEMEASGSQPENTLPIPSRENDGVKVLHWILNDERWSLEYPWPEPMRSSGLSTHWNWFTDYVGPGNCNWRYHISVFVTVIYGTNDIGTRRDLWHSIGNLLPFIGDEPWLVMGDFNTMLDMSEVCGQSGDICVAIEDFNQFLIDIALINLPIQGGRMRPIRVSHHVLPTTPPWCYVESTKLMAQVTKEEIKTAFFDIAEDKSPGPDGYSAGFFKAAWPIIGDQVTQAILDFVLTGKPLKQIHGTLLSLIPKVRVPDTVTDFWPISCCNVLCNAITEIIVHLLSPILERLISPSQNAFIPGRSINDNVLLTEELFSGYNQQRLPPWCALKVDLQKAYNTVEWGFLLATLQLFGFPQLLIRWVDERVTMMTFSVCLNGSIHGFFPGARDDLVIFCNADEASVLVFKCGFQEFANLSGLQANPAKSQLILSKFSHGN